MTERINDWNHCHKCGKVLNEFGECNCWKVECDCPDCIRIGRHDEQCSLCGDIYAVKSTEQEIQEAQDEYEWSVDLERAKEK